MKWKWIRFNQSTNQKRLKLYILYIWQLYNSKQDSNVSYFVVICERTATLSELHRNVTSNFVYEFYTLTSLTSNDYFEHKWCRMKPSYALFPSKCQEKVNLCNLHLDWWHRGAALRPFSRQRKSSCTHQMGGFYNQTPSVIIRYRSLHEIIIWDL